MIELVIMYILGCIAAFIFCRKNISEEDDPGVFYHLLGAPLLGILFSVPLFVVWIMLAHW